jgi:hypothetical protein
MLMALLAAGSPDFGKDIFEAATKVSSGFALGAFVTAGVVALIWIVSSKNNSKPIPTFAWVVLIVAVVLPVAGAGIANFSSSSGIHHATLLVFDKGSPVTDLLVFNSLNIPPKMTENAFEFDIPDQDLPADKKVTIYAFKDGRQGTSSVDFTSAKDKSLSVQITLPENALGDILRSPLEIEAESKGRSYFIQSAAMTFDIENVNGKRVLYWRTTYSIKALKDFDEKMEIFREEYNSDYASVTRWVGTEPEDDVSPKGRWYFVKLKMKRGETKTFMTGADLVYDKPFPDRPAFCKNLQFGARSDYAVFTDGVADGDYVGNILVLVTSHTIKLSPLRGANSGIRLTRTPDCVVQNTPSHDYASDMGTTISGSWYGLKPGEEVGVLYQW